jgi:hypothetical protein
MNAPATLARARVLLMGDHDLVFCCGTLIVTGAVEEAALSADLVHRDCTTKARVTMMTTDSRRLSIHARVKMSLAGAALALAAMTVSASAQGVVRGAEEGFYNGNQVFGPVGAVVGGAVGGVVGGVAGGFQGVLGIPQDTRTRAERMADNRQVRVVQRRKRQHVE